VRLEPRWHSEGSHCSLPLSPTHPCGYVRADNGTPRHVAATRRCGVAMLCCCVVAMSGHIRDTILEHTWLLMGHL
jgi:hypothetical protein